MQTLISPQEALAGRAEPMVITEPHLIFQSPMNAPIPAEAKTVLLGMGCYWGAERLLWQQDGVINTAVGFSGGITPNPTYKEVCTGKTGHAEVVRVIFDNQKTSLQHLLTQFWEHHNPTQGMRQGNDIGAQYRSVIYVEDEVDIAVAETSKQAYQNALKKQGIKEAITTEIALMPTFYFAETEHQQYLAKNPEGYCGLGGIGVCYPSQD